MRYTITDVTTATTSQIVSTADLKAFLRVTHSDEDSLIEAMRDAAVLHIENMTNTRLGDRTVLVAYEEVYDKFEIPIGPVSGTGFILSYRTGPTTTVTLTQDTDYYLDYLRNPAQVELIRTPSAYDHTFLKLNVTATVGYLESAVPKPLVHAIKLLVAHMYELRQPEITGTITTKLKLGLEALVNPYRIISFR